jgi:hypothetical protein
MWYPKVGLDTELFIVQDDKVVFYYLRGVKLQINGECIYGGFSRSELMSVFMAFL